MSQQELLRRIEAGETIPFSERRLRGRSSTPPSGEMAVTLGRDPDDEPTVKREPFAALLEVLRSALGRGDAPPGHAYRFYVESAGDAYLAVCRSAVELGFMRAHAPEVDDGLLYFTVTDAGRAYVDQRAGDLAGRSR